MVSKKVGFLFIDLETCDDKGKGSLEPQRGYIYDIAWILTDHFVLCREYQRYLTVPGVSRVDGTPWSVGWNASDAKKADLVRVLHYTNEAVFEDGGFDQIHLAGFNPSFDEGFLKYAYRDCDIDYPFHHRKLDLESAYADLSDMGKGILGADDIRREMFAAEPEIRERLAVYGTAHTARYDAWSSYHTAFYIRNNRR